MKIKIFKTISEKAKGLQGKRPEPNTLYVFPGTTEGTMFISQKVAGPFEIAFLTKERVVLEKHLLHPPYDIAFAPPGTAMALEAAPGVLSAFGL